MELVLNSTDKQGIFYCYSQVKKIDQDNKLMASIDDPTATSLKLQLKTEQVNSTVIRIRIIPNGYLGINYVSCYWNNNITYGQTAELIIGGIETKKSKSVLYKNFI